MPSKPKLSHCWCSPERNESSVFREIVRASCVSETPLGFSCSVIYVMIYIGDYLACVCSSLRFFFSTVLLCLFLALSLFLCMPVSSFFVCDIKYGERETRREADDVVVAVCPLRSEAMGLSCCASVFF